MASQQIYSPVSKLCTHFDFMTVHSLTISILVNAVYIQGMSPVIVVTYLSDTNILGGRVVLRLNTRSL